MISTYELMVDAFRWHLDASLRGTGIEVLLGPRGFHFERTHSTPIKLANHRAVHRVQTANLDLHVKHYFSSRREWWRCLFRGRRAVREFHLSREVARRGIPTIEVVGVGERTRRWGPSDCFLLTRTLPETTSLLDFLDQDLTRLPEEKRAKVMQRLADAMGRLLALQHRAGVRHDDLHPGNMLIRFVHGEPELFLIDLDMVHLTQPMNWPSSRDNLVVIDRWFAMRFSRSDRRRAWHSYFHMRPELPIEEREAAREVARATRLSLIHQMRQFDRRCLGGNRHYTRLRSSRALGYAVTDLNSHTIQDLIHNSDQPFEQPDARFLKRSGSSQVLECQFEVGGQTRSVIIKRIPHQSWFDSLKELVRPGSPWRSYLLGHGLRLRGLPTPRPLAVWHQRRFGLPGTGYLLLEKVPQSIELKQFVDEVITESNPRQVQRLWNVTDELARLIRQLHDWKMCHRDLKAANILVSPAGSVMSIRGLRDLEIALEGNRDRVWFVDLVGVRHLKRISKQRQMRDLARLHLSFLNHPGIRRSDRLRFLRSYMAWGLQGKAGWKHWWGEIHRMALAKAEGNRARGRVIG